MTITNKEADQEALDLYLKTGTVTTEYMKRVLGDSPKSVCAFLPGPNDPKPETPVVPSDMSQMGSTPSFWHNLGRGT